MKKKKFKKLRKLPSYPPKLIITINLDEQEDEVLDEKPFYATTREEAEKELKNKGYIYNNETQDWELKGEK